MVRHSNHVWWPVRFVTNANALALIHWRKGLCAHGSSACQ